MNHKYFPTKIDLDTWIKENTAVDIIDIVELDTGVYIKYIQMHPSRKDTKRNRVWSNNLYR